METTPSKSPLQKIPVYDIRLVQSRRCLRLAETTLTDAWQASRALHALIGNTDREHFAVLFVGGQTQVTGAHIVAIGGQHGINIEARTVFRAAITACASALILGHNHPSGDPTPSAEDIAMTAKLLSAGKLLGLPILDHVIVTAARSRWHSMLSSGTLPEPSP
jgi:DNA repair protein RadC